MKASAACIKAREGRGEPEIELSLLDRNDSLDQAIRPLDFPLLFPVIYALPDDVRQHADFASRECQSLSETLKLVL